MAKTKKFIKSIIGYILLSMLLVAVWMTYESMLIDLFNNYILPPFALFKSNIWNRMFVYAIVAYSVYVLFIKNLRNRYQYNPTFVFVTIWCIVILGYYRCGNLYTYESLVRGVTYVDVLIGVGVLYVLSASINYARALIARRKGKHHKVDGILYDNPIMDIEEDMMDWNDEVDKLLGLINQLHQSQPISIAINAPWGAGKTSFLRLLQSSIDTDKYEVVYFNPRESMSASEIQEDFFQQLISALAKYNGMAEHNLKKYMRALQIIDDKSWLTKLLNIYDVWNKESHRDEIKRICDKLPVKVIIIVDDFDRLLPDEIHQVLKLIKANASFSNFIFLTAYDKNIVNKMLEKIGKTEDAYFTDKFFDLEYTLPIRSYDYILDYIITSLCSSLHLDKESTRAVSQSIKVNSDLFQTNIPTIRDAKRLINQLLIDYHLVEGEVVLAEFIYVQLLKYKYPADYINLSHKQYVDMGYATLSLSHDALDSNTPCLPIIKVLFKEKSEDYTRDSYRHVYSVDSFDAYFFNKLYNTLKVHEMRKIFEQEIEASRILIDTWIKDGYSDDLSNYLNSFYIDTFSSKTQLLRYAGAAAYLAIKTQNKSGHTAFSRATYQPIMEKCVEKCQVSIEEYKKFIMDILTDRTVDQFYEYLYDLNQYYSHGIFDEENCIIKRYDFWPIIKADYLELVKGDKQIEVYAQDFIAKCVDYINEKKKSVLDVDCCKAYRSFLDRCPDGFMAAFVHPVLNSMGNLNMIGCNYYYLQIFGTNENLIAFANSCKERGVAYSNQVLNFMKLYEANEFEPLDFHGHGDLNELLKDYDFSSEVELLDQLLSINITLNEMIQGDSEDANTMQIRLNNMLQEVRDIDLNIALRDNLYRTLNNVINASS